MSLDDKKVGIIVQARMGSSRFPGKIMEKIDDNDTILDILIKRIKLCKNVDEIIIATSKLNRDSIIVDIAKLHGVSYYTGSETDVLKRYYMTAKKFKIDIVIRITSDCPFVDPAIIDEILLFYMNNNYDYIKNVVDYVTYYPEGLDLEIFSFQILSKIYNLAKTQFEKEYITIFIRNHPELFSIHIYNDDNLRYFKDLRLTLDYKEDLIVLRDIYKNLMEKGKDISFTLEDILDFIEDNPKIMNINKHHKSE